ncbi:hypothetical protein KDI_25640 [Dictyobacter arantiisoli]|uniref:Uncharacterized protein n=1 Tax=Dictyobacter arantiisoli TaxID=2014874 RepID=A0A5A5TBX4_9CHLR|nr:hypothetical protein KDI_25640 [Dictyobacter arantiisoli]
MLQQRKNAEYCEHKGSDPLLLFHQTMDGQTGIGENEESGDTHEVFGSFQGAGDFITQGGIPDLLGVNPAFMQEI